MSRPKPTKYDIERWSRFPGVGCLACKQLGKYGLPEVHHLTDRGRRRGHRYTIPLCPAHHRGVGFDRKEHLASVAHGRPLFAQHFGSDDFLLNWADRLIEHEMSLNVARTA